MILVGTVNLESTAPEAAWLKGWTKESSLQSVYNAMDSIQVQISNKQYPQKHNTLIQYTYTIYIHVYGEHVQSI